jgi:CheY-like chemotaxis protein/HPt (histidine-containing phosphotransfer) domain-containing protein
VAGSALVELLKGWEAGAELAPTLEACETALDRARAGGRPVQALLLDAEFAEDAAAVARLVRTVPALLLLAPMHGRREARDWRALGAKGVLRRPVFDWALREALEPVRAALREGRPVPWTGGEEEPPDPDAPRPLEGRRMLLVEDNPLNREVARAMLASLGAEVALAADGLEAVARCREDRFDLVLMDLQMPGLDGFGAARAIRGQASGRRTPILALTAHALAADEARAREAGMDGLLAKPVEKPDLLRAALPLLQGSVAPPPRPVDIAALQGLGAEGRNVAGMFLLHAPTCLQDLHRGIADRDAEAVRQAAHALNGMAAYAHAAGLRALCHQLEDVAARMSFTEAEALAARVATEHDRAAEALRALGES